MPWGDNAPKAHVEAAIRAVQAFPELEVTLIGNEEQIRPHLTDTTRLTVIHTTEKSRTRTSRQQLSAVKRGIDGALCKRSKRRPR